jgi:hypothetical protein
LLALALATLAVADAAIPLIQLPALHQVRPRPLALGGWHGQRLQVGGDVGDVLHRQGLVIGKRQHLLVAAPS